jgi:hypothetical protein
VRQCASGPGSVLLPTPLVPPRRSGHGLQEAKKIGEDFLGLEKYVNVNYMVSWGAVW